MEEEKKAKTEELKNEASSTVSEVKDTIKQVDIKKDSIETKGFVTELFKDPLGKIKEIVTKENKKNLTYAMIILAIWTVAEIIGTCMSIGMRRYAYGSIFNNMFEVVVALLTPAISILVMSLIILVVNSKNKKPLTKIITAVTTANVPNVLASVVSLLTIFSTQVSIITTPFNKLCSAISIVLLYFATKAIVGTEKNSEFIKKFTIIVALYYVAYVILSLFKIYI